MRLITYCDVCRRKHACTTRLKELKNQDFSNIVIIPQCSNLLLPGNTGCGIDAGGVTRDQFNHCDDCDFATKCKYYKHPEMLKEIDRVTTILCDKGYDKIRYTCELHRSNAKEVMPVENITIVNEKQGLFSWLKKGK